MDDGSKDQALKSGDTTAVTSGRTGRRPGFAVLCAALSAAAVVLFVVACAGGDPVANSETAIVPKVSTDALPSSVPLKRLSSRSPVSTTELTTPRSEASPVASAKLSTGSSSAAFATPEKPLMSTTRPPAETYLHWQTPSAPMPAPIYSVVTDPTELPTFWGGNAQFLAYKGPTTGLLSSANAFKNAVKLGAPRLDAITGPGRLALVSYTNEAAGPIQPDGTVKLEYVDVPAWVLVFPLDGSVDLSLGGFKNSTQTWPAHTGCRWFVIVDGHSGEPIESGGQCDP